MKIHLSLLVLCSSFYAFANETVENYDPGKGYLVVFRYDAKGDGKFTEHRRVKVGHANFWKGTKKSKTPKAAIIYQKPGQKLNPKDIDQGTIVISPTIGQSNYDNTLVKMAVYKEDAKTPSLEHYRDPEYKGGMQRIDKNDLDWPIYYHDVSGGKKNRTFKIYGQQKEGFRVEW